MANDSETLAALFIYLYNSWHGSLRVQIRSIIGLDEEQEWSNYVSFFAEVLLIQLHTMYIKSNAIFIARL